MPRQIRRAAVQLMANTQSFLRFGATEKTFSEKKKTFPEIKLSYSFNVPFCDRVKVTTSSDITGYMRGVWKNIEHRESFYAVYLNRLNHVLGYYLVSLGGLTSTVADVRIIYQAALLANACSIIIMHNHPSGNPLPSEADKLMTKKIKDAGKFLDIPLLDHIIMLPEGSVSFADEGLI